MNRLTLAGLALLLTTVVNMPVVQAKPIALNTAVTPNNAMTPFTLVSLAYQGHFRDQGIHGYSALFADGNEGRISAKKLVQVAVNARELPTETLKDRGFMTAVEANLDTLRIPSAP